MASVGWSCFPHLNVFPHWPLWSTTEAHKSAFKLWSFERKCHLHTKTLASGRDLGVGLWQLRGSPWEPARFNHRASETHSGSCWMEWRCFWVRSRSSWTDCEERSVTKVETDLIYFCEENARDLPVQPCHHDARRWYAVAKVFRTKKKNNCILFSDTITLIIYIYV